MLHLLHGGLFHNVYSVWINPHSSCLLWYVSFINGDVCCSRGAVYHFLETHWANGAFQSVILKTALYKYVCTLKQAFSVWLLVQCVYVCECAQNTVILCYWERWSCFPSESYGANVFKVKIAYISVGIVPWCLCSRCIVWYLSAYSGAHVYCFCLFPGMLKSRCSTVPIFYSTCS